jgi:hypothetical protein
MTGPPEEETQVPDHSTGDNADGDVAAWLCTHLTDLTADPGYPRWAHKLDAALTAIRAGTPALQALTDQHIPISVNAARGEQRTIARGDLATLADYGIDPVAVTGDYTCPAQEPAHRCPRRCAPGPDGQQPRCGVHNRSMPLRPR